MSGSLFLWEGTSCSARVKLFCAAEEQGVVLGFQFWALDLHVALSPLQLLGVLALSSSETLVFAGQYCKYELGINVDRHKNKNINV